MAVTYPANMPTSGVTSIEWTNTTSSLISRSPFSLKGQAQSWGGAIRFASITVENLNRAQAQDWLGFLDSLNGTIGTFLFGDPMAATPQGSGGGGPTVRAVNSATRDILTVDTNLTGTINNWLRRGDWIQLGQGANARLYKVCNHVAIINGVNYSNNINVWPKFRSIPQAGDPVIILNPQGLFRRSSGAYSYSQVGCNYSLSFDCEEVF